MTLHRLREHEVGELREFLEQADLTRAGVDTPTVRIWIERDRAGRISGTTGFEMSADGRHALIRSVAVVAWARRTGAGSRLAAFALEEAAREGATRAWLFSRRSGPFWQSLGFEPADRDDLSAKLGDTHQVRLFVDSGQLERELAWSRPLVRPLAELTEG